MNLGIRACWSYFLCFTIVYMVFWGLYVRFVCCVYLHGVGWWPWYSWTKEEYESVEEWVLCSWRSWLEMVRNETMKLYRYRSRGPRLSHKGIWDFYNGALYPLRQVALTTGKQTARSKTVQTLSQMGGQECTLSHFPGGLVVTDSCHPTLLCCGTYIYRR